MDVYLYLGYLPVSEHAEHNLNLNLALRFPIAIIYPLHDALNETLTPVIHKRLQYQGFSPVSTFLSFGDQMKVRYFRMPITIETKQFS